MIYLSGMNKNGLGQQTTPDTQNCTSECVDSLRQMPGLLWVDYDGSDEVFVAWQMWCTDEWGDCMHSSGAPLSILPPPQAFSMEKGKEHERKTEKDVPVGLANSPASCGPLWLQGFSHHKCVCCLCSCWPCGLRLNRKQASWDHYFPPLLIFTLKPPKMPINHIQFLLPPAAIPFWPPPLLRVRLLQYEAGGAASGNAAAPHSNMHSPPPPHTHTDARAHTHTHVESEDIQQLHMSQSKCKTLHLNPGICAQSVQTKGITHI